MDQKDLEYWRKRGLDDARKGKSPIFRGKTVGDPIVRARGEWPHDPAKEQEAGGAYLDGYDSQGDDPDSEPEDCPWCNGPHEPPIV